MKDEAREKEAVELLNLIDISTLTLEDAERIDNAFLRDFLVRLFREGKDPGDVMHQNHSSHSNHTSHTNHHNTAFELNRDVRMRLTGFLKDARLKGMPGDPGRETPDG